MVRKLSPSNFPYTFRQYKLTSYKSVKALKDAGIILELCDAYVGKEVYAFVHNHVHNGFIVHDYNDYFVLELLNKSTIHEDKLRLIGLNILYMNHENVPVIFDFSVNEIKEIQHEKVRPVKTATHKLERRPMGAGDPV